MKKTKDLDALEGEDRLIALKKKYLNVNARVRKSIELGTRTDALLLAWWEERWRLDQ